MSSSNSKNGQKINGTNGKKSWKGRKIPSTKDYKLIFDRMEAGTLKVDLDNVRIYVLYKGQWIEPHVTVRYAPTNPTKPYLFVTIYHKNHRKKVGIARLMWMVHNGEESIPDGFDVSHDDDDTLNNHYSNLDIEPIDINRGHASVDSRWSDDF